MPIYALTIFTAAFLLFLVQPLMGKYILPWFGGAPAVWTTCLLFFQALLLAGYAYAHGSAAWLKPRAQAVVHLLLLAGALALLPITPSDAWKPTPGENPTWRILALLLPSVGLPYFVLAATSPLMQHWFGRTHPGVSPYRFYALSNAGSVLALVSFPVVLEPALTRARMARLWGWGLALYAAMCAACAIALWRVRTVREAAVESRGEAPPPPARATRSLGAARRNGAGSTLDAVLWLLLPTCASVLLLATTNMMCQQVVVMPFLWVLPLGLYLLSFIICFDGPGSYRRVPFGLALLASWGGMGWLWMKPGTLPITVQLGILSLALFVSCMMCHGELYRLRPGPARLTGYYLTIAAGGALGGVLVAVIAPLIFSDYFEYPWGLLLCGLVVLVAVARGRGAEGRGRRGEPPGKVRWPRALVVAGLAGGVLGLGALLGVQAHRSAGTLVERSRNFYGVLTVFRYDDELADAHLLQLSHGPTLHGVQFTDSARAAWPTTYYGENSGVGLLLRTLTGGARRVGLVGLGVGTLAAYAQPGDVFHFYEINPEVERLAGERFTFLKHCHGRVEMTTGDARLSLEREPPQKFDVLVLDAFNGDAIPVHLLTKEAFAVYQRQLKADGVIAVHVSNRSLDLEEVVGNLAREGHYRMVTVEHHPPPSQTGITASLWTLLSREGSILDAPAIRLAARPPDTNSVSRRPWTDDFASLFQVLRSRPEAQQLPDAVKEQSRLAFNRYRQGDCAQAIALFEQNLKRLPRSPVLLNHLAWMLATCPEAAHRNVPEAVRLAERSCQVTHYETAASLSTLGVAYSEAGRFEEAIWMAEKAEARASAAGAQGLADMNRHLLPFYRRHQAYHEAAASVAPAEQ